VSNGLLLAATQFSSTGVPNLWSKPSEHRAAFSYAPDFGRFMGQRRFGDFGRYFKWGCVDMVGRGGAV
jgi:hypothetical protein